MSVLLWIAVVVLLSGGPPLYLRMTAKGDVRFKTVPGTGRTLFVHMPGLMGDGLTQIENVMSEFTAHGSVVTVHYNGCYGARATTFDWRKATILTALKIVSAKSKGNYDSIVFVGTSMGGKLAFVTAQWLRFAGIHSKAILIDAPLGRRDFQFPLNVASPALKFVPFVPVLNLPYVIPFLGRLVIKNLLVVPPKKEQIEASLTDRERKCLDATVTEARKTKMPFHRAEVLSILAPLDDDSNPWDRHNVVFIRSGDDNDTVRETAYGSWTKLLGGKCHRLNVVGAQHCSYGQKPSKYRPAFRQACDILGVS